MRAAVYKDMSKVRVHITVSADGYVAGPNQTAPFRLVTRVIANTKTR